MAFDFTLEDILPNKDKTKILAEVYTHRDISCTSKKELEKNIKISNLNFFNYGHSKLTRLDKDDTNIHLIQDYLANVHGGCWDSTACFIYPKDGFMGWHTNNLAQGIRCYFTYSFENDSNFFRYRNPYTKEIIDSYDEKGWNVRFFHVNKENPFWHCVVTNSKRYSFGFNWAKEDNPSEKLIKEIELCLQSQSKTEDALKTIGL